MTDVSKFHIPDQCFNEQKQRRNVGFELEFAGIDADKVANIVARHFGTTVKKVSEAEFIIKTSQLGKFRVELDWNFGRTIVRRRAERDNSDDDPIMKWMTSMASQLVPIEIICPPIALDQLNMLSPMIKMLREEGALGTEQSFLYAFGLHLNPEIPDFRPLTIANFLKAFVLAQEWLIEKHDVDVSRRILPYINLYPMRYASLVMNYDETTTLNMIVTDYLQFNPTRNRALDMLPLLKYLYPEIVKDLADEEQINERPTFHYRLPNCEIEQPDWGLNESWNIWCVVEYLAANHSIREQMILSWRDHQSQFINFSKRSWHPQLDDIHQNLL